jgi:hypothetical protein
MTECHVLILSFDNLRTILLNVIHLSIVIHDIVAPSQQTSNFVKIFLNDKHTSLFTLGIDDYETYQANQYKKILSCIKWLNLNFGMSKLVKKFICQLYQNVWFGQVNWKSLG